MIFPGNSSIFATSSAVTEPGNSCGSSLLLDSVAGVTNDTGLAVEWSIEEQYILKDGLEKYKREPNILKYIKIAATLPDKTVRDVALRSRWMQRKRRKPEELYAGRKDKPVESSSKMNTPSAMPQNMAADPLTMHHLEQNQRMLSEGIFSTTMHLLKQNSQVLNQITFNLSACQMPRKQRAGKEKVEPSKKKGKSVAEAPTYQYKQRSMQVDDDSSDNEIDINDLLQDSSGSSEEHPQLQRRSTGILIRENTGSDASVPKRRGEARASSPSRTASGKKAIYFVGDSLLGDQGLSGFFRPQMRNELDGFYPNWVNVPSENKHRIFESFLKEWSIEGYSENFVYNKFMQQNGEKYRKFLSDLKRSQMKLHKCKNVIELLEKPKPAFMKSQEVWEQYVRHWNSPEQKVRSLINKKNRAAREGASHGYGY